MSTRTFGLPANEVETEELSRILHQSFVSETTADTVEQWLATAGPENLRVLRENGQVLGCLVVVPMGIFLGGRAVPTAGVAGVGVAPSLRGRGVGRELMIRACEEFRETYPLSSLYASNYGIYRSVGYERAGGRFLASASLRDLPRPQRELEARLMTPSDTEAVKELYRNCAKKQSGALDRGPYVWNRVEKPRNVTTLHSWLIHENDQLVGFARWHQPTSANQPEGTASYYDLDVIDVAATNARAIQRIFTLFADHSSIAGTLRWWSGPDDPFLLTMADRYYRLELSDLWMIRILDVEKALLARGYPRTFSGELHFGIEDSVLGANVGNYLLSVVEGEATLTRGGEGLLHVDTRSLAALYSGYLAPETLQTLGWIEGSAEDLAKARALFSGPVPWCRDMY